MWFKALVVVSAFLGLSAGSFLLTYQEQFSTLSKRVTWELVVSHETNRDQNRLLRQEIMGELANGTVAMRRIRYESNQRLAAMRREPNADQECMDAVASSLTAIIHLAEKFLQNCASDLSDSLDDDAQERFFPTAAELARESTYMTTVTLDALGERNPMLHREDIEARLDAELNYFYQEWLEGQYQMQEDLDRHVEIKEAVVTTIHACAEGMVEVLPGNIDNVFVFAENNCFGSK